MYYTPPRRRPVKRARPPIRRARPTTTYYMPPEYRGRIHGEKMVPTNQSVLRRPRRLIVRTRTIQVIMFLIVLGLLAWYSGLLALLLTKITTTESSLLSASAPRTALVYPGQHSIQIQGAPTITAAKIENILCSAGSPACGSGQEIYSLGIQANINPAYALAFFQHESSFGLAGAARYTHSLGNLRCIPNYPCPGGYASFPSWSEGFQAWYALIDSTTYVRGGHTTIETIIPIYAPPSDNNDDGAYINAVVGAVQSWHS